MTEHKRIFEQPAAVNDALQAVLLNAHLVLKYLKENDAPKEIINSSTLVILDLHNMQQAARFEANNP